MHKRMLNAVDLRFALFRKGVRLTVFCADQQTGVHEEAQYLLRHRLFEELLKEEKFMEAANCLGKLNLEASSGKVSQSATRALPADTVLSFIGVWRRVGVAYLLQSWRMYVRHSLPRCGNLFSLLQRGGKQDGRVCSMLAWRGRSTAQRY